MTFEIPQPSATVIVLRPRGAGGLEVFMLQRHARSAFLPNVCVFPGGRVDEADEAPALRPLCLELPSLAGAFPDLLPDRALAHQVAALRELFEEAGILIARRADGSALPLQDAAFAARLRAARDLLCRGELAFASFLEAEGLRLELGALCPYAHWVTPKIEGHRFDTRFFLLSVPIFQHAEHEGLETVASRWLTPEEALKGYEDGTIDVAPPTLMTLLELSPFSSLEEAVVFARERRIVRIEAELVREHGQAVLTLPGDPAFPFKDQPPVSGPTRFCREGKVWRIATLKRGHDL